MPQRFTHLHVASGYSLRYGASSPRELVAQASAEGLTSLALTDRDGLYGAVKFVNACAGAGIKPALGVNLAVEPVLPSGGQRRRPAVRNVPEPGRRVPVRGGASVDPRLPRVTVLALASGPGTGLQPGQGWGRLCRLITATQVRGERGRPVSTIDLIAEHAQIEGGGRREGGSRLESRPGLEGGGRPESGGRPEDGGRPESGGRLRGGSWLGGIPALTVLLGPDSEFGRAVLAGRAALARAGLDQWAARGPPPARCSRTVRANSAGSLR